MSQILDQNNFVSIFVNKSKGNNEGGPTLFCQSFWQSKKTEQIGYFNDHKHFVNILLRQINIYINVSSLSLAVDHI